MFLTRLAEENRKAFNRLALLFFALLLSSVADLLVHTVTESDRVFKVVAGGEARVSGKLLQPVDRDLLRPSAPQSDQSGKSRVDYDQLLAYAPESLDFRMRITDIQGRLWRGMLWADAKALPGEAGLQVFARPGPAPEDAPRYTVRIYPDAASYRKSFLSISKRFLGVQPLWVPLALFPLAFLFFAAAFKATRREEEQLQAQGIGPIYKLAKRKGHWEIVFGLGSRDGVRNGQTLRLLDPAQRKVAEFDVDTVAEDYSTAKLELSTPVRSDYLVDSR